MLQAANTEVLTHKVTNVHNVSSECQNLLFSLQIKSAKVS